MVNRKAERKKQSEREEKCKNESFSHVVGLAASGFLLVGVGLAFGGVGLLLGDVGLVFGGVGLLLGGVGLGVWLLRQDLVLSAAATRANAS